ncbi:MAG: LysR family transcriptional regulator [Microbacteriaceae bacterium]|nr:LysR family transcriptional regulator [Microbacteriaceae bacterium]
MSTAPVQFRQPNVTIRQLFHFVTAADAGTLAEAGRKLHMAPSALSYSIDQLEAELGVQLCIRHKAKGLTLTPSGKAAVTRARNLLADARDFEMLFSAETSENYGRLVVGSSTPIAPLMLPATQRTFVEQFPHATVEFLEETQTALQEKLRLGAIDLAFLYDLDLDHRLERIPLMTLSPNVLLPMSHPLAADEAPEALSLDMLANDRWVLFGATPMYEAYMRLFRNAEIVPDVAHTCRSMGTLRAFVGRGIGLGLSYEQYSLTKSVDDLAIRSKPLVGAGVEALMVCIALASDFRPSVLARFWIESARDIFSHEQPSLEHDH